LVKGRIHRKNSSLKFIKKDINIWNNINYAYNCKIKRRYLKIMIKNKIIKMVNKEVRIGNLFIGSNSVII
jgi:hypothetical protein